jgi:hypothetical protein
MWSGAALYSPAEDEMPFFSCTVNEVGPAADGTETSTPVIYINLTDTGKSFVNQWFYAAEGSQAQMLSVGLAAMNTNRQVEVDAVTPNKSGSPYTSVARMYLTLLPAQPSPFIPVIDLNGLWNTSLQIATISVNGNSISIELPPRPTATGTIIDPSDILVNFPDATTVTGKLQPPSTIAWSNGTSWHKAP